MQKPMLLLALLLGCAVATPALAKPSFSIADTQCQLGNHCVFTITKTGLATSYSDISFATSGAAGESVKVTKRFLKANTVQTVAVNSLAPGQFTATIKIVRYGVMGRGTAIGTVIAPPAPPPANTPPPVPVPAPSFVPSPSLDGAAYIPDNADPQLALQPSWGSGAIPPSSKPDVIGALRFICTAGQVLPDDPIVYPGQPGKSHLHQFYGNTAADAYSTYESLRTKGESTCNRGVANPMNRSGYWMPAMLDALGVVVKPSFAIIYYKRRPITDPKCSLTSGDPQAEGDCLTIPNALRFIFGYDMVTNTPATGSAWFNCQGPTSVPGHYANLALALANCPAGAGNQVGAIIEAPTCWDGKNLDSPNHRSHMGYPSYGSWGYLKCPADHHYVIPAFTLGAWYPVVAGMHLSCDAMLPNAPAGTCWHADYWEAWNEKVKAMWTDNDINKQLNASGGDLGNGLQMKGAQ